MGVKWDIGWEGEGEGWVGLRDKIHRILVWICDAARRSIYYVCCKAVGETVATLIESSSLSSPPSMRKLDPPQALLCGKHGQRQVGDHGQRQVNATKPRADFAQRPNDRIVDAGAVERDEQKLGAAAGKR